MIISFVTSYVLKEILMLFLKGSGKIKKLILVSGVTILISEYLEPSSISINFNR